MSPAANVQRTDPLPPTCTVQPFDADRVGFVEVECPPRWLERHDVPFDVTTPYAGAQQTGKALDAGMDRGERNPSSSPSATGRIAKKGFLEEVAVDAGRAAL
ncbi:hypothetical protein [Beijerinckia sp. L45]|uniref:hypothetical protein n=1 Tax=Beijerinckia sp. L45 TaxID=1641855 RepID=UPI00131E5A74|nr:hypothetical protein [Beijerinckia sp. L45]